MSLMCVSPRQSRPHVCFILTGVKDVATQHHAQHSQSSEIGGETQESGLNAFRGIGTTRALQGETQDTQQLPSDAVLSPSPLCGLYTQPVLDRIIEARSRKIEAGSHISEE